MSFTVAIVGRPNVGKSTLFNRLVGKRLAIVHDLPGVTRDRREGKASLLGMDFQVVDTAGFEDEGGDSVEARMRRQTDLAVSEADVALLLIDARAGVTPLDRHFADHLRRLPTPVILVANKCEGKAGMPGMYESYGLGMGEPVPVSAEHGEGMYELFEALRDHAIKAGALTEDGDDPEEPEDGDEDDPTRPLTMAIVGRPNVGKSTLGNQLLGQERLLTGPEAGLTRDAIAVEWEHRGRRMKLVDTAGLRKKAQIYDAIEKLSVGNTIETIRMSEVVVLVMDAAAILDKQDLTIARLVVEEGRALVLAINKWDMVDDPQTALKRLKDRLETSLPQAKGVATVTLSALTGRGVERLMDAVVDTWGHWNRRIPTAQLNRWLEDMIERHPPPALPGGRRYKIRYMTQAKARPPTFVLFATRPEELPESYSRYLVNGLREAFDLPGVPVRLYVRGGKNPYADKDG
ncbi:GTPase involved in ribosome synthesis and maintenance(GTP-binding protein EngA,4-449) [Magnetospirillum sp. XM-1]|uniref:ribosome biogenesis GTPase Der n=1 Tax=Magnetospirillum sp. XM-1 TaxID=1663591 RepID=UPI00073DC76E|nr:ribosome biogenesis GTPase Der [Magnetospirillum sp. XM-1]CUW39037.1 GTPase involved in ribosome synthesis and maintenance(GTP-binding protein EngA,4-449) [Magnetospirillum sp. XM-1]